MFNVLCVADIQSLLLGGGERWGVALAFLCAAALVVLAGTKLSKYGDALGERTGLGSGLVGLLFLAAVTSLPELVVSTTSTLSASMKASGLDPSSFPSREAYEAAFAALMTGGADLAVGNMVGSNLFNLMIFAIMDIVQGPGAFLHRLSRNHIMSAASSLVMLGILLFGLAICAKTNFIFPWLEVGPVTPLLLIAYIVVMTMQGKLEKKDDGMAGLEAEPESNAEESLLTMSAAKFYGILAALAALIVVGGMWLSLLGDVMAQPKEAGGFGLGQSFVGTIFLAISTSLPEVVVSVAAVRMGCYNMAAGNVLGSNIFNLVIVFTSELGMRGGSLLHYASPAHLVTIAMAMVLTSVVMIGIMFRSNRSFAKIGLDVWVMIFVYVGGNVALYFAQ
jgi:cation:H+ antiporter